uniref:Uncharacterized protein n=1 Tax=Arundo donax TaxID=35708 RepID=A0A0A8ZG00_ARUDO
MYLCMMSKL